MNRRGLALAVVLWLVVALAGVTSAAMVVARQASNTAANRVWLMRARWAHDACWAALAAARSTHPAPSDDPLLLPDDLPTTELGGDLWCSATWEHPEQHINLNAAGPEVLQALLGESVLVDALLDWRDRDSAPRPGGAEWAWYRAAGRPEPRNGPLADLAELGLVRGFDSARVAELATVATVEPGSRLDLNTAPFALLARLPGLGAEALSLLVSRRSRGMVFSDVTGFATALSAPAQGALGQHQTELLAVLGVRPEVRLLRLEAGLTGAPWRAVGHRRVVVLPERLVTVAVEAP